jgi:S1-C subfamily serine protease
VRDRSIVTNAERHLGKRHVFNLDLEDFFGSIHFGRVKNLFKSVPFCFPTNVATILAQICCVDGRLPQGAPTSPVVSNMIAWKLDGQLQELAKVMHCTYTRYADDISFSFTCSQARLPEEIVVFGDGIASPGHELTQIIRDNGFRINYGKVRLASRTMRMEVTGLTVNRRLNVRRRYVRQVSAMLHAWEKFGYAAAEQEFNERYSSGHRPSGQPRSFAHVLRGKLSFLRSIRGPRDAIFNKLARRYNHLVASSGLRFDIFDPPQPEREAAAALWVLESIDPEDVPHWGTGFLVDGVGIVTCAHVVSMGGRPYRTTAFKWDNVSPEPVEVILCDSERDIAVCRLDSAERESGIVFSSAEIRPGLAVKLMGFPDYGYGDSPVVADARVLRTFIRHAVTEFEIDTPIREGNSGGPVVDEDGNLVGVAHRGATGMTGRNSAISYREVQDALDGESPQAAVLSSDVAVDLASPAAVDDEPAQ